MLDTDGCRYCDRCGVKLTPENNKNGFELCDRCDKQLHEELKAEKESKISHEQYVDLDGLLYVHWGALTKEDAEAIKKIINDAVEREGE